jgi:MraZ protein
VEDAGSTGVHLLKGKVAQMFMFQYQHNIDDKGRLMIPAAFREMLVDGAYVTLGFDGCLMVMTSTYFAEVYRRLNEMNLADPDSRLLRRLLLGYASRVEVDKVGRVLLPAMLRQAAKLEGDAMVVGQGEYFEIWAPAEWNKELNQLQDTETNSKRFAALDLSAHF